MLNEKQKQIYDLVLNSKHKSFYLKGKAGVGKSFVVSQIAKDFNGSVLLTATTNKAKKLLSEATNLSSLTTHSALGFVMTRNGKAEYLADINEAKKADLLIVDEASMLPKAVYEKILKEGYKKILFVGDEAQLSSIGLKADIKADVEVVLTKQMRQADNEELANYLDMLRDSISSKTFPSYLKAPKDVLIFDEFKDFAKAYNECKSSKRILAYSNKVIDSYNLNINGAKFNVGDVIVLDKPLVSGFKNGDTCIITKLVEHKDYYVLDFVCEDKIASDIMVFKTKKAKNLFFDSLDIKSYWSYMDKCVEPKQIYASTIHKAQGDSIDSVFIDVADIYSQLKRVPSKFNNYNRPIAVNEFVRLLYVAISRMREKAYLFVGNKREYKYLRESKNV